MKKKLVFLSPKQIVMIVAPLATIGFFTCFSFTNIINDIVEADSTRYVNSQMEKVEEDVVIMFQPPALALNMLADTFSGGISDESDMRMMLRSAGRAFPMCQFFYFGSARDYADGGLMIYSNDTVPARTYRQSEREWFTGAVAARGSLCASEPYVSATTGKLVISFSRAIYDGRNQLVGVVSCNLLLDELSDIIGGISISPNTKTYIVDQKGLYLTNQDAGAIMKRSYFEDSDIDSKKYNSSTWLDGTMQGIVDGRNFYSVRKLAETPWFVVMEGPISDFVGTFRFWGMFIAGVVIVLIVGNVVWNGWLQTRTNTKEARVGEQLVTEVQSLVVAAKENAATSQDQSAAVKEIVATMSDTNELSENISEKVKGVADVAQKTNADVADGVAFLEENVKKLHEIAAANSQTIDGIKSLGTKIENIWDIVTLINSVADQAKIIAFNAELEASSAGEAGKNFHIVATEIRRLADGIIDGTKEIKERINEIQQSSDSLVLASESGTEKINEGVENAKSLEEKFAKIKNASETTATSAGDITTIIQQQTHASEQILITLKQIAAGVENFTAATENISTSSQNLKVIAEDLNKRASDGLDAS